MTAARKPKSSTALTKPVSVKFEPNDLEEVKASARAAGLTPSEYLREAALLQSVPLYPLQQPLAELTAILVELRRRLANPRKLDGIELMHLELHVPAIKRLVVALIKISGRRLG